MALLSPAMARDIARFADDLAVAIARTPADRADAERFVAALVAFAGAGADLSEPHWTGPTPDIDRLDAIVRVTAGWPDDRVVEASAWQLVVSAVRLTALAAPRRATG